MLTEGSLGIIVITSVVVFITGVDSGIDFLALICSLVKGSGLNGSVPGFVHVVAF